MQRSTKTLNYKDTKVTKNGKARGSKLPRSCVLRASVLLTLNC